MTGWAMPLRVGSKALVERVHLARAIATVLIFLYGQGVAVEQAGSNGAVVVGTKRASFVLKSSVPKNPLVTCHFMYPVDPTGKIEPGAANLVCYFTHPNQKKFYEDGLFVRLASEGRMTVFGIYYDGVGPGGEEGNRKECYYYPESGSGFTAIEAQEKIIELLGISRRKLFLTGYSGGASSAQQFAVAYPALVDAVAITSGRRFAEPAPSDVVWLHTHSRHDAVDNANLRLHEQLIANATSDLYIAAPPEWSIRGESPWFSHSYNADARNLLFQYLLGVSKLREAGRGVMPPSQEWPIAVLPSDPMRALPSSLRGVQGRPDALSFPSKGFQDAWASIPPPMERFEVAVDEISPVICELAKCAPAAKCKGGVIYLIDDDDDVALEREYDIEFLASSGFSVLAVSRNNARRGQGIMRAFKKRCPEIRGLPMYVIGYAPSDADIYAFHKNEESIRISGRFYYNIWPGSKKGIQVVIDRAPKSLGNLALIIPDDGKADAKSDILVERFRGKSTGATTVNVIYESLANKTLAKIRADRMRIFMSTIDAWESKGTPPDGP